MYKSRIVSSCSRSVASDSDSTQQASWQRQIKLAIRDSGQLCRELGLPESRATAAGDFPVFVPPGYVARMRPGDPDDPLLRQVLPLAAEFEDAGSLDPVGDLDAELMPGVIQKYDGRVLLVTTGVCAVHCRYCFRRHFPYARGPASSSAWEPALSAIAEDASLREVILSGGDPLMLVDHLVTELVEQLATIGHLRRLRIHTRLPVMIPDRITDALVSTFSSTRLTPVMVIHANHAQELDATVIEALTRLRAAGIVLLNQAVLLREINDSVAAQVDLCEALVNAGVMPYYLHQLDRVRGALHFEVPVAKGLEMVEQLRSRLPGYAVPRYVQETAGARHKIILA